MNEDKDQQTTEVRETNERAGNTNIQRQRITTARAANPGVVARNIIYYIAGIIVVLLALRIMLLLLAANQGNAFVDFIYGLSGVFAWPFYGIFSYQPSYGHSTFEISSVVAILVYSLAAWGLAQLFTLTKSSAEE
jgi:hypothetical protein